jgi:hypothetical protein
VQVRDSLGGILLAKKPHTGCGVSQKRFARDRFAFSLKIERKLPVLLGRTIAKKALSLVDKQPFYFDKILGVIKKERLRRHGHMPYQLRGSL